LLFTKGLEEAQRICSGEKTNPSTNNLVGVVVEEIVINPRIILELPKTFTKLVTYTKITPSEAIITILVICVKTS